jgi:multimeric flavodoxin WrbA
MILGISGGKINGSTDFLVKTALAECKEADLNTKFVNLFNKHIEACRDCGTCKTEDCKINDDMQKIYKLLESANAIIIGSPVYFAGCSSKLRALMERTLPLRRHDFKLKNKIGGAIAVGGSISGGQEFTIREIQNWMLLHSMIVVGDKEPTTHFGGIATGRTVEDTKQDSVGIKTVKNLGRKIAETVILFSP